jgi:uncharacterized protein YoxC
MAYPNMLGVPQDIFNDGRDIFIGNDMYFQNIGANTILAINDSKKVVEGGSTTELSYLKGATSNIQLQINTLSEQINTLSEQITELPALTEDVDTLMNQIDDKLDLSGGELTGDIVTHHIEPDASSTYNLGTAEKQWDNVYAETIHGDLAGESDARLKKNIKPIPLGLDFITALQPKTYKYKRHHVCNIQRVGLVAQDVEEVLEDYPAFENNGFIHINDGIMSLNYVEFIAPLIQSVQELSQEVRELREQIQDLSE